MEPSKKGLSLQPKICFCCTYHLLQKCFEKPEKIWHSTAVWRQDAVIHHYCAAVGYSTIQSKCHLHPNYVVFICWFPHSVNLCCSRLFTVLMQVASKHVNHVADMNMEMERELYIIYIFLKREILYS